MQKIFDSWGGPIAKAVVGSAVSPALVAALVANESGGDWVATRFEPDIFARICQVLAGKRAVFSAPGIKRALAAGDFLPYVLDRQVPQTGGDGAVYFRSALNRIAQLATSYGLTQIMGWHYVEFSRPFEVLTPSAADELAFTVELLEYFAAHYGLDLATDAGKLLDCWNTGQPGGHTFDPQYIERGLGEMAYYSRIVAGTP